jgi:hypothetical protein
MDGFVLEAQLIIYHDRTARTGHASCGPDPMANN